LADYEAGTELIDKLKQGQTLVLEGVDAANSPISLSVPLAGFASAYDGPAQAIQAFEEVVSKREMQERQERQKRAAARCESKQW
jgi:hypothetical protein